VTNSAVVLKRRSWRRPLVTVRFGKPIVRAHTELNGDVTDVAHALTEDVMVEIAKMLPPELQGEYREAAATDTPVV